MVTDDLPHALAQLASFGRSPDIAIRPVLLRVMVDMFANKPHHAAAEIQQFEEILSHILGDADATTRMAVADKLGRHPQTPKSLLDRLVSERGAVAKAHVARPAVAVRSFDTDAVLGTTQMAVAAAQRPDLDPSTVRRLAERPEAEILHALVSNFAAPIGDAVLRYIARRARNDTALAVKMLERPGARAESAALFLPATREQRAHLIADARRRDLGSTSRTLAVSSSPEALAAVERAARGPALDGLDVALASLLGLSRNDIDQILDDRGGEPLALALAAVGASRETAGRIFIFSEAGVGHSYKRVKALVAIVDSVSPRAAYRLVMGMLGRSTEMVRKATPQPEAHARRPAAGVRVEPAAEERVMTKLLRRRS